MRIGSGQLTYAPQQLKRPAGVEDTAATPGLGQQLTDALREVNALDKNAGTLAEHVVSGNIEDAHKAVIAMEHAVMALDLTLQVRNKVLEAYQEIMRTQL